MRRKSSGFSKRFASVATLMTTWQPRPRLQLVLLLLLLVRRRRHRPRWPRLRYPSAWIADEGASTGFKMPEISLPSLSMPKNALLFGALFSIKSLSENPFQKATLAPRPAPAPTQPPPRPPPPPPPPPPLPVAVAPPPPLPPPDGCLAPRGAARASRQGAQCRAASGGECRRECDRECTEIGAGCHG